MYFRCDYSRVQYFNPIYSQLFYSQLFYSQLQYSESKNSFGKLSERLFKQAIAIAIKLLATCNKKRKPYIEATSQATPVMCQLPGIQPLLRSSQSVTYTTCNFALLPQEISCWSRPRSRLLCERVSTRVTANMEPI